MNAEAAHAETARRSGSSPGSPDLGAGTKVQPSETARPLISLRNAGKQAGGRWLVRGVSLDLRPGEITTLIGPNGSGKSTTAEMALGILTPTEGEVVRARSPQGGPLRIGFVPQKVMPDWSLPLSVKRFMSLTQRLSAHECTAALEATGAAHLQKAALQALSGGELQRVLMARAIARKPELLVLDEPVQGVDFRGEIALYDLIGDIRDRLNCAILLISHDLHVVMSATDQVICLNGHVCCQGSPQSVTSNAEFRKLFGPVSGESLALFQHDEEHHLHGHSHDHGDDCDHDHSHDGGATDA